MSGRPQGLKKFQCKVEGRWPEPLDVVRFGYVERLDDPAQPENVLIDEDEWKLRGLLSAEQAHGVLAPHLATSSVLLGNRGSAVAEEVADDGVDVSLALIEPIDGVEFLLRPPEETRGKLKSKAVFRLGTTHYELRLTDYLVQPAVLEAGVGTHSAEALGFDAKRTLLTISLAEAQNGWHTKLVAAVLFLP